MFPSLVDRKKPWDPLVQTSPPVTSVLYMVVEGRCGCTFFCLALSNHRIKTSIHPTKAKEKLDHEERDGETGNRTQNLLHLTSTDQYDAKKMSYH